MGSNSRSGLFVPDERGIGGAMEIAEEYHHFFTGHRSSRPSAPVSTARPSAQQLSYQRAMKQATSNTVTHDHLVRLSHMFRRLAAPSSSLPQQSTPQQPRARPASVTADLCPWRPRSTANPEHRSRPTRPSSAPEQYSCRSTAAPWESNRQPQQRDWQQLKAAAHPQPHPPLQPVQLPPSRFYLGPNLLPSVQHRFFKAALMGDILQRQLYKAADIRQLCVTFIHQNPPEHRSLLRKVAAEVLHELEVPYTTELDC